MLSCKNGLCIHSKTCINGSVRAETHSCDAHAYHHSGFQSGTKCWLAYRHTSAWKEYLSFEFELEFASSNMNALNWFVKWTCKLRQTYFVKFTVTPNLTQKYDQTSSHESIKYSSSVIKSFDSKYITIHRILLYYISCNDRITKYNKVRSNGSDSVNISFFFKLNLIFNLNRKKWI